MVKYCGGTCKKKRECRGTHWHLRQNKQSQKQQLVKNRKIWKISKNKMEEDL